MTIIQIICQTIGECRDVGGISYLQTTSII